AGPAVLPRLRAVVVQQVPPGEPAAARGHGPARAAHVARERPAVQHAGLRGGVRLQGRRQDGPEGPLRGLVITAACVALVVSTGALAKVKTEVVAYKDGDTQLEGVLAYDDANKDRRPGVVIVHDWMGMSPYWSKKAEDLAALGYVAFAAD